MKPHSARRLLVIEDDQTLNRLLCEQVGRMGHQVNGAASRAEALEVLTRVKVDLAILDLRLPDADGLTFLPELREYCPAIVLTAQGSIDRAVQAVRAGAADFLVKPAAAQVLELAINRVLDTADMRRDLAFWQGQATVGRNRPLLGQSAAMDEVRRLIALFAGADSPVLILGEDGAGKETCAMALHALSPRANGRFVVVECHAGPTAEEIFGEMRPDADGRIRYTEGLIASAEAGTVYLAGVDALPRDVQSKLLRILETGSYRPVGSNVAMPCPARLMLGAAQSAETIAAEADPQAPLLFRMLSFVIKIPALRDRPEDIRDIAETLLDQRGVQRNVPKRFSADALRAMRAHHWPGNLRELRNAIERGLIMSAGEELIGPDDLGIGHAQDTRAVIGRARNGEIVLRFAEPPSLDDLRSSYLRFLLEMTNGNRREIAHILGISERTLYRQLPQLGDAEADTRG